MKGMNYQDILTMSSIDRVWYIDRLNKQLQYEADEVKKARKK
jgi:hypothetical protein